MNVRVDLNYPIKDGTEVLFRSPVDCSQVTGLKVYYLEDGATKSQEFAFADAHGNNVGDIDHLFAENVVVKVILDVTTAMAFVQNADTNAYLEGRFAELDDIVDSLCTTTAIGNPIEITDHAENRPRSVKVLHTAESEVDVYVSGKNLLTLNGGEASGITCTILEDGGIHVNGTPTAAVAMTLMPGEEFARLPAGMYVMRVRGLENAPVVNVSDKNYTCGLVLMRTDKTKNVKFTQIDNPDGEDMTEAFGVPSCYLYVTIPAQFKGTSIDFTLYPTLLYGAKIPTEEDCKAIGYTPRQTATIDVASQTGWEGLTLYNGYTKVMSDAACNIEVEYLIPTNDAMDTLRLGMSRYYGENVIYTPPNAIEQGGLTITPKGGGKYTVSGTKTTAQTVYLYYSSTELPPNILKGCAYRIGKTFPDGVILDISTHDGSGWTSCGVVSNTKQTRDIVIPDNAVGMRIALFFGAAYKVAESEIDTEMVSVSPVKYAEDLVKSQHPDIVPPPPPMLTIIDDDGYIGFKNHLLPIIESKCVPIASAVPIAEVAKDQYRMTWADIEECAEKGAEILSHTYNNIGRADVENNNMTVEQIAHDYRKAQAHLRRHGILSDGLVFVMDSSNVDKCVTACEQVYQYGFKASSQKINYKGSVDRYGIYRHGGTFYTQAALESLIDKLVSEGTGWLVFMLHTSTNKDQMTDGVYGNFAKNGVETNWANWAPTLAAAIDYAISKGVQIVTTEYGARTYCD